MDCRQLLGMPGGLGVQGLVVVLGPLYRLGVGGLGFLITGPLSVLLCGKHLITAGSYHSGFYIIGAPS